jgi:hypothetical protein
MQRNSYRLTAPTLGMIRSENGHRTLVTIPQRAVITVVDGSHGRNRMSCVMWSGKTVMMFTQDVRERGEMVPGPS